MRIRRPPTRWRWSSTLCGVCVCARSWGSPKNPELHQILHVTYVSTPFAGSRARYFKSTFCGPNTRKVKKGTDQWERKQDQNMLYVDVYKYDSQAAKIRSMVIFRISVVNITTRAAILRESQKKISLNAMESRILHKVCDPNQSE
jgi:hypothetical protein